jgi:multicomponent Na+:H+ antiporter subunit G
VSLLADVVTACLVLGGAGFVLLAGLGLHRFDDVFSRVHAATKAVTFGMVLVVLGSILQITRAADVVKLLLAVLLQLISAPVSSHIVARAAYHAGTELSPLTAVDDLVDHDDAEVDRDAD